MHHALCRFLGTRWSASSPKTLPAQTPSLPVCTTLSTLPFLPCRCCLPLYPKRARPSQQKKRRPNEAAHRVVCFRRFFFRHFARHFSAPGSSRCANGGSACLDLGLCPFVTAGDGFLAEPFSRQQSLNQAVPHWLATACAFFVIANVVVRGGPVFGLVSQSLPSRTRPMQRPSGLLLTSGSVTDTCGPILTADVGIFFDDICLCSMRFDDICFGGLFFLVLRLRDCYL